MNKPILLTTLILTIFAFSFLSVLSFATLQTNDEMTNHLYSANGSGYPDEDVIDHYVTNFTLSDNLGQRAFRVGFVASDAIHGYYIQAFFQENPLNGTFEHTQAATHTVIFQQWTNGVLKKNISMVANNKNGHSQLKGGLMPNRTIIAGDFVDFFINQGYLQIFWYQTNTTIHNQQQIFSTNIQVPSNFGFTDEYRIFTPNPGAMSLNFTNFKVAVIAQQISNIFPHDATNYSQTAPVGSLEPTLNVTSNLCFDTPKVIKDKYGIAYGVTETMLSSDLG